ncbi:hypothetical protein [Halovenus salina]|uniref:Tetrapyrrole biosynthesis glutamyl-tRNA reductase dimerisation domain-containing protein n=1 Tax=Halovenus salina TaxID=1510225 RepID=A0ABD5VYU8_9EURY
MSTEPAETRDDADPTAAALEAIRRRRSQVRQQELDRAMDALDLTPRQALVVSALSHRLVGQLTAPPPAARTDRGVDTRRDGAGTVPDGVSRLTPAWCTASKR